MWQRGSLRRWLKLNEVIRVVSWSGRTGTFIRRGRTPDVSPPCADTTLQARPELGQAGLDLQIPATRNVRNRCLLSISYPVCSSQMDQHRKVGRFRNTYLRIRKQLWNRVADGGWGTLEVHARKSPHCHEWTFRGDSEEDAEKNENWRESRHIRNESLRAWKQNR